MHCTHALPAVLLLSLAFPIAARSQGIAVDEGRFAIEIAGRSVGTEDFTIRRAGIGRDDAFFANAVITQGASVDRQEITPLLRATPPSGVVAGYQVKVTGRDPLDFQMTLVGQRYVAIARSQRGDEEREFPARETTRILDRDVAHHYYFLRDAREGERIHVIEPRTRTQTTLIVERRSEDELTLDGRTTPARRLEFNVDEQVRIAWYDRLGRVLRVEIPALGYVAERTDLVG
ncbi:MAG: hypothetical protein WD995_08390 [Gemmatimonadota bacterium]